MGNKHNERLWSEPIEELFHTTLDNHCINRIWMKIQVTIPYCKTSCLTGFTVNCLRWQDIACETFISTNSSYLDYITSFLQWGGFQIRENCITDRAFSWLYRGAGTGTGISSISASVAPSKPTPVKYVLLSLISNAICWEDFSCLNDGVCTISWLCFLLHTSVFSLYVLSAHYKMFLGNITHKNVFLSHSSIYLGVQALWRAVMPGFRSFGTYCCVETFILTSCGTGCNFVGIVIYAHRSFLIFSPLKSLLKVLCLYGLPFLTKPHHVPQPVYSPNAWGTIARTSLLIPSMLPFFWVTA